VQAAVPVEQEYVPVVHPLLVEHGPPAAQLQLPAPSQELAPPVPAQLVPAFCGDRFVHTWVPGAELVVHEKVPASHPPLVVQAPPATQLQLPLASQ
jgi:hypothetical protein